MRKNLILNTDSYKFSHFLQYPADVEYVSSYIESRGGKFDRTVFFGLQYIIKEYLTTPITLEDVLEAEEFARLHGEPFHKDGWIYVITKHGGYLPIEIWAAPEGTVIGTNNVLVTIRNTDPAFFWLPQYIEDLLVRLWYPITVATYAWHSREIIRKAWRETSDLDISMADFSLVDFGARGVSSEESAAIGGMAHLVSFKSSDNIPGIMAARRYYHEKMAGYSIPAAEHSTITSWGKENEAIAYRNMIKQFGSKAKNPSGMYAVVSDSYDIMNAVGSIWGDELRDEVLAADNRLILRPDSDDPLTIPVKVIQKAGSKFGTTLNSKGYKVLNPKVRAIQGDGIDIDSLPVILRNLTGAGYAADNLSFGMGGGLLQQCNRDTQKFAMKCSAAYRRGEWQDVFKEAPGKKSKRGLLALIRDEDGVYHTVPHDGHAADNVLRQVFRNGDLMIDDDFETIRNRANGVM